MPISEVYNEDNMIGMSRFVDQYFDLAIVDPPYGINAPNMSATPIQRKYGAKRLNGGGGKLKGRVLNTANIEWDYNIPDEAYFAELFRISKNQVIWGGNYFHLYPSRCIICWDKVQPWENFSQIELAWTSFDKPAQIYKFDNRTGDKIHPTQKPIELYRWVLSKYANAGDKILDTHMGSQSSRIAAYNMGFDYWGWEIDKEYFDAGNKRFAEQTAQLQLFKSA